MIAEIFNALRDAWAWAYLHPWISASLLGCVVVNNVVRGLWKWDQMPRWARIIAKATDVPALSFWAFAHRLGIDRLADALPDQVVRNAVAAQDAKDSSLK